MEFVNEDPYTYKVDILAGEILNSWILKTKSVLHKDFLSYSPPPEQFELPDRLAEELKSISLHLLTCGVGYTSIDLMQDKDELKIIELNTSGVGRNITWANFFDTYLESYPRAIQSTLQNLGVILDYNGLRIKYFS